MADLSKAALLARLSYRIHETEMELLEGTIDPELHREIMANLVRQVEAIEALDS